MDIIKNRHVVHQIMYHIVFCTKYRNKVLNNNYIEMECKKIIAETCINYNWKLVNIQVLPDHVHLLIQTDHLTAPVTIVQTIKSISAVYLFTKFPDLKKRKFWGSGLWSPSTFYGTCGNISQKTIDDYINKQKEHHSSLETSSKVS